MLARSPSSAGAWEPWRDGDVPGFEIPSRYFQFVRSGDAAPLAAVLEHNRLDLLSLAGLTARLLDLVRRRPEATRATRGKRWRSAASTRAVGLDARAMRVVSSARSSLARRAAGEPRRPVIDALRLWRFFIGAPGDSTRPRRCWQQLLEWPGCPPSVVREASEALAIHHEHRVRDLAAAKAFALRSLAVASDRRSASSAVDRGRVSIGSRGLSGR